MTAPWGAPAGRRRVDGVAIVILIAVLLAALAVTTFATSYQGSTTARAYARIVLTRACLEAATCAFAEAQSSLGRSAVEGRSVAGCPIDWKRELLPPYQRARPRGAIAPKRTREEYGASHGLELSDVEVAVVHWVDLSATDEVIRGHGVLELSVVVRGSRSWLQGSRSVRRRVQFYCRHKPVLEWPPSEPPGHTPRTSSTPGNSDVVILTSPLASVIDS